MKGNKSGFFAIYKNDFYRACNLGMNAAVAYLVLSTGTDKTNKFTSWSVNAIESYTGIGRKRAQLAIQVLLHNGLIRKLNVGTERPRYEILHFEPAIPKRGKRKTVESEDVPTEKRLEAEKIILTDKYIVGAVRDNLAGKKVFLPNSDDGKQPSLALIRQFRQNIVSVITHAFFVVEAERNPSSVVVHQMALDLAAAHNNLEEFLGGVADNPHTKKAPMMRVGAVAVARKKNDILSRYMPWHVEYIGDDESSSKTSELEFGIIELVTKEALIFDEWLRLRLISPEFMNEALLMACDEWYGIDDIFSFKSGDKNKIADFLEKFLKTDQRIRIDTDSNKLEVS